MVFCPKLIAQDFGVKGLAFSKQNNKYFVLDDELKVEEDGFSWIETSAKDLEAWDKGELRYVSGAKDRYGNVLIPFSRDYEYVFYSNDWNEGIPPYFEVSRGDYMGICTIDGTEIIAPKFYGYVFYDTDSDVFVYTKEPAKQLDFSKHPYYSLGISINKRGEVYRSNKAISPISDFYSNTIQGFATLSGQVTCKGQGVPYAKVLCNDVHWNKSYSVEADSYGNYSICIPRSPRDFECVIYAQGNGYYDSYAQYWQGWDENHYMNFELEPIVNQSSYANVNSNNYGSSISDASKAFIFGAIILGGAVAIIDALSNSSSSSTSSSKSSLDPCWSNDIPGSDKVWLSEANFEQSSDYLDGKSRTEVTLKFHNDNNWPMKVTYQVVYKNEKSSDKPDLRWIGLEKDDRSTTETIVGQPGKVIECIKLRKIEPARY